PPPREGSTPGGRRGRSPSGAIAPGFGTGRPSMLRQRIRSGLKRRLTRLVDQVLGPKADPEELVEPTAPRDPTPTAAPPAPKVHVARPEEEVEGHAEVAEAHP